MPMTLEDFYKLLGERDTVIFQLQRELTAVKIEKEKLEKELAETP